MGRSLKVFQYVLHKRVLIVVLAGFLLQAHWAFSQPEIEILSDERKNQIVKALLAESWQAEALAHPGTQTTEKTIEELNQEQLWQGNVPKFDMHFTSLAIDFLAKGKDGAPEKVSMVFNTSQRKLQITHSLTASSQFRGGVRFDNYNEKKISQQFLLGSGKSSVFIFAPYWGTGSDLHLLVCPRSLEHLNGNDLVLKAESMLPESVLWGVTGRLKALLFSGTGAGSIRATIETSDAIAPAREQSDVARGVNPVADLVYQPVSGHQPAAFPREGDSNQAFLMILDMQLPAGYRRNIVEGIDLWVSQVAVPATDVSVPVGVILETKAASAVPEDMRYIARHKGLKAHMQAGDCTLIVAQRRATKKIFKDKESLTPAAEAAPLN
jgi:hypothetical protein